MSPNALHANSEQRPHAGVAVLCGTAVSAVETQARRLCHSVQVAAIIVLATAATAIAQPPADPIEREPNDRLPRKMEIRILELIRAGQPEKVERVLADQHTMFRFYVARAHAGAGLVAQDPAKRERHFAKAIAEYREVIALQQDARWFRGQRRRFNIAQYRVELADLILKHWIAPDLDRYEITSGLHFDAERITERLRQANAEYVAAGRLLGDLMSGVREDEERYLLLGIADDITTLHRQRKLNAAWAKLYLAMIGGPDAPNRNKLLGSALGAFDKAARSATKPEQKYNALLGAGIALQYKRRFREAEAAFDKVIASTAPPALAVRARHEKARLLIETARFAEARRELDALAAASARQSEKQGAGILFYQHLVPVIRAYAYLREAEETDSQIAATDLKEKAFSILATIADRGGVWPEIARVYITAFGGDDRSLEELTDSELRVMAGRLMEQQDYEKAIDVFGVLRKRPDKAGSRAQAGFNLAVCRFQLNDLRTAAEAFTGVAREVDTREPGEKAAEYAYRCWRQTANASKDSEDYLRLAESAQWLSARFPAHALAEEAVWIAALARQEGGDYRTALTAYAKVAPTSANYWPARRNIARCKQGIYETLPETSSATRRRQAAMGAAVAWKKLATDLAEASARAADKHGQDAAIPGFAGRDEVDGQITAARLTAATLLAGDNLRAFRESLQVLAEMEATSQVLRLRIRCLRGLGDFEAAHAALADYMTEAPDADRGAVLVTLAASMEAEIAELQRTGRQRAAVDMAAEAVETIQTLLSWIESQESHRRHAPVVRHSLVKALTQAGRTQEAMRHLERLMADQPEDGSYIRTAAQLQESLSGSLPPTEREKTANTAETLWARLLEDRTLRDQAPGVYWEARYHWLRHQLRHGRAADVAKGVAAEQAWYPELGGPPWQARLLRLAEEAREQAQTENER